MITRRFRRKRIFWAAIMWPYKVIRFKRDRLAALTFQTAIHEIMAFKNMMGRVQKQQDALAYDKLKLYLLSLTSRIEMHDRIENTRSKREFELNTRVTKSWRRKMNLTRWWTWRCMVPPMKREFQRRFRPPQTTPFRQYGTP